MADEVSSIIQSLTPSSTFTEQDIRDAHAAFKKMRKRKAPESSAALVPTVSPGPLSQEQRDQIERNREEAALKRTTASLEVPPMPKQRVGAHNQTYEYNDINDAIKDLNTIFGFHGWENQVTDRKCETCETADGQHVHYAEAVCTIVVRSGKLSTRRQALGCATLHTRKHNDTVVKGNAKKAAESDALKRAARLLGTRFTTVFKSPGPAP